MNPALIKTIWDIISPVVDSVFRKEKHADFVKRRLQRGLLELDAQTVQAQASVLTAEARGTILQRSWRPHLMYLIMGLIAFYGFVVPIVNYWWIPLFNQLTGLTIPALDATKSWNSIPEKLWTLLQIGMGGYV